MQISFEYPVHSTRYNRTHGIYPLLNKKHRGLKIPSSHKKGNATDQVGNANRSEDATIQRIFSYIG